MYCTTSEQHVSTIAREEGSGVHAFLVDAFCWIVVEDSRPVDMVQDSPEPNGFCTGFRTVLSSHFDSMV